MLKGVATSITTPFVAMSGQLRIVANVLNTSRVERNPMWLQLTTRQMMVVHDKLTFT